MDAAKAAFTEWAKRYKSQGYYSSNKGRIPLDELEENCKFPEANYTELDLFENVDN